LTIKSLSKKLGVSAEELKMDFERCGVYKESIETPLNLHERKLISKWLDTNSGNNQAGEKQPTVNENKHPPLTNRELDELCKRKKIFIDTCTFLNNYIFDFLDQITPYLQKHKNKIFVTRKVYEEILKKKKEDPGLRDICKKILKKITEMDKLQLIEMRGEQRDQFADLNFLTLFNRFSIQYELLLITQDNGLAEDVLNLNNRKSVRAKAVSVRKLVKNGDLSLFWFDEIKQKKQKNSQQKRQKSGKVNLPKQITTIQPEEIKVKKLPEKGNYVTTKENGRVLLKELLASGGEGDVYKTNTEYVAKIYKNGKITKRKLEKLKLMTNIDIEREGICWPNEMIFNSQNEFVGYLMPLAKGNVLYKEIVPIKLLKKKHPDWTRRDLVVICITILEKILYLHKKNILIGDINLMNILVETPEKIYFVDTDSYQIENFPCPVGTAPFTPPEIHKDPTKSDCKDFLKTFGNEYFAIATLLFMIIMPGKHPYSQQDGAGHKENIIKMNFSYPYKDKSNKKTPIGTWRFLWSHLPYRLKENFYKTFRKDAEYSSEDNRLSPKEWLNSFKEYLYLIDSGKFTDQDEMALSLLPTRHKKVHGENYSKCKICGKEEMDKNLNHGICPQCLGKEEVYHCSICGKEMTINNYEKYVLGKHKYDMCEECYKRRERTVIIETCKECGQQFGISLGEKNYFESKGLDLPKRCSSCRDGRRNNKDDYYQTIDYSIENGENYSKCKICRKEEMEKKLYHGICPQCLGKEEVYHCSICGKEMTINNYEKYILGKYKYDMCEECYKKRDRTVIIETCKECGQQFGISLGEKNYFESKGLDLPKRCSSCRDERRNKDYGYNQTSTEKEFNFSTTCSGVFWFILIITFIIMFVRCSL